jgi:hypothetical protein
VSGLQLGAGVGIGDDEFLAVQGRVGTQGETAAVTTLDVDEEFLVLGAQALQEVEEDVMVPGAGDSGTFQEEQ